jgi:hypothetical protein
MWSNFHWRELEERQNGSLLLYDAMLVFNSDYSCTYFLQRLRCIHHHLHAGISLFRYHWRHLVPGWQLYSFHMANTLMTLQIPYFLVGGPISIYILSYIQPIFCLFYKYLILSFSLRFTASVV